MYDNDYRPFRMPDSYYDPPDNPHDECEHDDTAEAIDKCEQAQKDYNAYLKYGHEEYY